MLSFVTHLVDLGEGSLLQASAQAGEFGQNCPEVFEFPREGEVGVPVGILLLGESKQVQAAVVDLGKQREDFLNSVQVPWRVYSPVAFEGAYLVIVHGCFISFVHPSGNGLLSVELSPFRSFVIICYKAEWAGRQFVEVVPRHRLRPVTRVGLLTGVADKGRCSSEWPVSSRWTLPGTSSVRV